MEFVPPHDFRDKIYSQADVVIAGVKTWTGVGEFRIFGGKKEFNKYFIDGAGSAKPSTLVNLLSFVVRPYNQLL
jgi:hypothetical protein